MYRVLKQKREMLKALRIQKKQLNADIKSKRLVRKEIDQQMAKLREDIRTIKGKNLEW